MVAHKIIIIIVQSSGYQRVLYHFGLLLIGLQLETRLWWLTQFSLCTLDQNIVLNPTRPLLIFSSFLQEMYHHCTSFPRIVGFLYETQQIDTVIVLFLFCWNEVNCRIWGLTNTGNFVTIKYPKCLSLSRKNRAKCLGSTYLMLLRSLTKCQFGSTYTTWGAVGFTAFWKRERK